MDNIRTVEVGGKVYHVAWSPGSNIMYAKERGLKFMDEILPDMASIKEDNRLTINGVEKLATIVYIAVVTGFKKKGEECPYSYEDILSISPNADLMDAYMEVTGLSEVVKAMKDAKEEEQKKTMTESPPSQSISTKD